jgi:Putative transposase DNA-binding domain
MSAQTGRQLYALCLTGRLMGAHVNQDSTGKRRNNSECFNRAGRRFAQGRWRRISPTGVSVSSSQTCSVCGCVPASSPKGLGALGVRQWRCDECGTLQDRDVSLGLIGELGDVPGLDVVQVAIITGAGKTLSLTVTFRRSGDANTPRSAVRSYAASCQRAAENV